MSAVRYGLGLTFTIMSVVCSSCRQSRRVEGVPVEAPASLADAGPAPDPARADAAAVAAAHELPPPATDDDDPAHPRALGRVEVLVELSVGMAARVEELPGYAAAVAACFRAIPRARRSEALPYRLRIAPPVAPVPRDTFAGPTAAGGGQPSYVEDDTFTACVAPRLPSVADLARYSDLAAGRIALAFVALAYTRAADARAEGRLRKAPPP